MERKESEIYNLELHEVMITSEDSSSAFLFTTVMRVAGGWIYRSFDKSSKILGTTFVPFNNEFQTKAD